MRTLLVEDDPVQRAQLETWLVELGLEVTAFEDASRALMEHLRRPCELMVIDWVMPEMDGLQLCRRVRSLQGGDRPYVLVVTGRDRPDDLAAVLDAGADDYVAKPARFALLQTRVRIAERRLASEARHRAAREALARSEADFGRVVERSPLGVVAERHGRIVYANAAAGRTFGVAARELVGTVFADLAQPEYRHVLERRSARFARSNVPPPPMEMDLRKVDGGVCVVRCIPATTAVFEGERAMFTMLEDITEQRQLQASLQQADRLASVGSMAAGVAHEINNPLAYVVTNLELLQEAVGTASGLDAALRRRLESTLADAVEGSQRVRHIVGDLRRFARTEDEDEDDVDEAVDLHAALDSAIDIADNEIKHRARLRREHGDIPAVRGPEGRLTQVLVNLLVNAAHAVYESSGARKEIVVRTGVANSGDVELTIEDSGIGIPAEILDRIFDPFFTTKPQGVGTGLGLSICHGIVTRIGGSISVQSVVGKGTTFTITLKPAVAARPTTAPRRTPAAVAGRSLRILLVDDEPLVCEGIKRALGAHDVVIASGGADAIERCTQDDYDLVLCDVMMPEVSGMEVFRRVRRARPETAERFVFMTGGAFTPTARSFLDSVENEQIVKPFSLRDLRQLVARRGQPHPPASATA
ncbi:MAG: response regulator [Myxococcota bacterium]